MIVSVFPSYEKQDIFAQLFSEYPDVGEIAYIGASTHRITRDYSIDRRTI